MISEEIDANKKVNGRKMKALIDSDDWNGLLIFITPIKPTPQLLYLLWLISFAKMNAL